MVNQQVSGLKNEYIPGVCNIGPAEIRLRRSSGWMGLGLTILLWFILAMAHTAQGWRLFVFLPAALGASGFLQAAFHFCANFGMRGLLNFGPEAGKTDNVIQAEFRKKDRQKAMQILLLSMVVGIAVALAAFFIRF